MIVCVISHEMGIGPNFAVGVALSCTLLYFLVQELQPICIVHGIRTRNIPRISSVNEAYISVTFA